MVTRRRPAYVPERGHVVWLDFDPQAGHEQAGRRPALILSPRLYNEPAGLALLCPITSKAKGYPFEVAIPSGLSAAGVILADQLKNMDWKQRRAEFLCQMPQDVLTDVLEKVLALLDPTEEDEEGGP